MELELSLLNILFAILAVIAVKNRGCVQNAVCTCREVFTVGQFYVIQAVVHTVQAVVWRLNGVHDHLKQAEAGAVKDSCVHVQHIIHRGVLSAFNHPRPWDFIGVHQGFTDIEVLLDPHVTIYCITETHAYFVQTPPHVAVHHSSTSPFFYMAQFKHAQTLLAVPLEPFHETCDTLGDPRVPVTWISNTGRCGSTLLVQMLEQLPGIRCFSEPDCLTNLNLMAKANQMPPAAVTRCLRSCIRHICRPGDGVERIAIKPRFNCVTELEEVMTLFPDFKHVYMYRQTGETMQSYYKLIQRDLACRVLESLVNSAWVTRWVPYVRRYLVHFISGEELLPRAAKEEIDVTSLCFMGWCTLILLSPVREFIKIQERHMTSLPTLHYNHLMERPRHVTQALFQWLGLDGGLVERALTAMEHDTQAGTMLSNKSHSKIVMTSQDVRHVNLMLRLMDVADMAELIQLPGDIEAFMAARLSGRPTHLSACPTDLSACPTDLAAGDEGVSTCPAASDDLSKSPDVFDCLFKRPAGLGDVSEIPASLDNLSENQPALDDLSENQPALDDLSENQPALDDNVTLISAKN